MILFRVTWTKSAESSLGAVRTSRSENTLRALSILLSNETTSWTAWASFVAVNAASSSICFLLESSSALSASKYFSSTSSSFRMPFAAQPWQADRQEKDDPGTRAARWRAHGAPFPTSFFSSGNSSPWLTSRAFWAASVIAAALMVASMER